MRLEWLVLADAAQVVGGKLYLLGGGWETLMVNALPVQQKLALALACEVEWNETNERHKVELLIEDEDGKEFVKVEGAFEVGRPPGIAAGQSQRFQLVVDTDMPFEKLGTYVIRVRLQDSEQSKVRFHVVPGPLYSVTQQRKRDEPNR